jgi:integrase/recombinase XerD
MKLNANNERLKRRYFGYLKGPGQLDSKSIEPVLVALARFEAYTGQLDFGKFRQEQAVAFKTYLDKHLHPRTGRPLGAATIYTTMKALHRFFSWLADEPGFRSRINRRHVEFLKASRRQETVARAVRPSRVASVDQIRTVLLGMPQAAAVEKRDRALIAFTLLTGARDDAIASTRLKHVDLVAERLFQDGSDMRTKFGKTFPTFFFPVGDDIKAIVTDWVKYLKDELGFGADDALFPPIKTGFDPDGNFIVTGFDRRCWANADPIRAVFKHAFENAGLPNFNPHSFRRTLTQFGMELGIGEAGLKAWSQNLGHEDVLITLRSYGELPEHRQQELIRSAAHAKDDDAIALQIGRDAMRRMRGPKKG